MLHLFCLKKTMSESFLVQIVIEKIVEDFEVKIQQYNKHIWK